MQRSSLISSTWCVLVIGLLAISSGCGGGSRPATADLSTFENWAKEFAANPHTDVLLPDAEKWFSEHFEASSAVPLAAEYRQQTQHIGHLPAFFGKMKAEGKTVLRTREVSSAIDMSANGLQNAALQRMRPSGPLFTMEFLQPGKDSGTTLWSFIYVDGKFRFLGKMTALNPTRGDLTTDLLCQMPLGTTEKLLREKGLLNQSAVEHLQGKGILR